MAGIVYVLEELEQKLERLKTKTMNKGWGIFRQAPQQLLVSVRAGTAETEAQKAVGKLPSVTRQVIKGSEDGDPRSPSSRNMGTWVPIFLEIWGLLLDRYLTSKKCKYCMDIGLSFNSLSLERVLSTLM